MIPSLRSLDKTGDLIRRNTRHWIDNALDLIFPPRCVHCKRMGSLLCANCLSAIEPATLPDKNSEFLDGLRATAHFGGAIQSAVHAFKYQNLTRLADPLAQRLQQTLQMTDWRPTLIAAVPLHSDRTRERGYNQAALLATRLAEYSAIPFEALAITRIRATPSQVGLNYAQRQANMADAFTADRALVDGQAVLVIDDVYTTGATLRGCAAALRASGAHTVWGLTIASA